MTTGARRDRGLAQHGQQCRAARSCQALSAGRRRADPRGRRHIDDHRGRGVPCVVRPSGSGKTTLMDLIAGLRAADSGRRPGRWPRHLLACPTGRADEYRLREPRDGPAASEPDPRRQAVQQRRPEASVDATCATRQPTIEPLPEQPGARGAAEAPHRATLDGGAPAGSDRPVRCR